MRVDEDGQRRSVAVIADIGVMGPQELIARDALARGRHARQAEIGCVGEDRGEQRVFIGARLAGAQVGERRKKASFLRHLISFYGDSLESVVPNYLENSMQAFAQNQEQMRDYMQNTLGDLNPMNQFEEMGKKNVAMFEETMKMFMPFFSGTDGGGENMTKGKGAASSPSPAPEADGEDGAQLDELRDQLEQMQQQIDKLTSGGKK